MARHPYSASERRGIMAVVAISLLVVGSGFLVKHCQGGEPDPEAGRVEVLYRPDSIRAAEDNSDTVKRSRKRARRDSAGRKNGKRARREYRRRSPLDEGI